MEEFDFSPERVTAGTELTLSRKLEFEKSLQRLGLDYVDILYVHDVEYGNLDYIIENTIPALRKLQQSGKCKFIGITGKFSYFIAIK